MFITGIKENKRPFGKSRNKLYILGANAGAIRLAEGGHPEDRAALIESEPADTHLSLTPFPR